MICIFDPACELLPPRNYTCVLLPLYLLADLFPPYPLPKLNVQYIQTVCGCGEGGVELYCTVDHILQEIYTLFLTRFRNYKIASPPQTKMASKDDIRGLVSLKFLPPCLLPPIPLPPRPRNLKLGHDHRKKLKESARLTLLLHQK